MGVSRCSRGILDLAEEVKAAEPQKKKCFLEDRLADLDQYTRMNDDIVTGMQTKRRQEDEEKKRARRTWSSR